jgi:hypothetical protein
MMMARANLARGTLQLLFSYPTESRVAVGRI